MDIIDDQGWGAHAVIPRFKNLRTREDDLHRALGIYNLQSMPYATHLHNVRVIASFEGDLTRVSYETPLGTLNTCVLYDEEMRSAGISITHILEHAIKDVGDYDTVGYIFENAEVVPNPDGFAAFQETIGERGIAVGYLALAASPMHLLQRELMPMEHFFNGLHDHPDELGRCADCIGAYYQRILETVNDCTAEVFLLGANYDAGVTPPPFFRLHILPWLRNCADRLHQRGKFLLTHTDGENFGLLDLYLEPTLFRTTHSMRSWIGFSRSWTGVITSFWGFQTPPPHRPTLTGSSPSTRPSNASGLSLRNPIPAVNTPFG